MRSLLARMRRNRLQSSLILAGFAFALVAAMVVATEATSRPAFCATCHEMTPYYDAWGEGPHASVDCVACHVDPGIAAEISHKAVALQEVYVHYTGDPKFPGSAEVPDSRCVSCHEGTIDPGIPDFDHETHRAGRPCVSCHAGIGHTVSSSALAEAGILDPEAYAQAEVAEVAAVGEGAANLEDHAAVVCSSCHDLAATGCASCHKQPAQHEDTATQTCLTCHATDADWDFSHPATTACTDCHTPPAEHYGDTCATCHDPAEPFTAAVYEHPAATADCLGCHERPASHSSKTCATCHETGVSWKFIHPTSKSCSSCHKAPGNHYGTSCSSCHTPSTSWGSAVFKHPASTSSCLSCHSKPSGHSTATCATCHKTGVSWKFIHTTSKSCSSCHKAPGNHYGTSCSSCHTPGRSWGSASFSHPRVPGGEHTYKSFSCSSCHPSGYSSYSCLKCHSSNDPDDDDDD